MGTDALAVPGNWNSHFPSLRPRARLTDWLAICVSRPRRASPGAENGHGPVPVLHLWIPARHHRVVRGERRGLRVRGKTLPAVPGGLGGLPLGTRGWDDHQQHPRCPPLRGEASTNDLRANVWQNSCRRKKGSRGFQYFFCVNADVLRIHGFKLICVSLVAEPSAARQDASGFGTELQLKAFHWCQTENWILKERGGKSDGWNIFMSKTPRNISFTC